MTTTQATGLTTVEELERAVRAAMLREDWAEAERIGDLLDAVPAAPVPPLGSCALWYAEQQIPVFPLRPGSKVPFPGSGGFKDATTDPERVTAWWARQPSANIGVATGVAGYDVIDIDGEVGVKSWAAVADELPHAFGRVSTPRAGGTHLWVRATGAGCRAGVLPGIDYRGRGGYVVAPPSVSAHGVRYRWRGPLDLTPVQEVSRG